LYLSEKIWGEVISLGSVAVIAARATTATTTTTTAAAFPNVAKVLNFKEFRLCREALEGDYFDFCITLTLNDKCHNSLIRDFPRLCNSNESIRTFFNGLSNTL